MTSEPIEESPETPAGMREAKYRHSVDLPQVLQDAGAALVISTYQAGQVVSVGVAGGKVDFSFTRFDQPMGVAIRREEVAIGSRGEVWSMPDHSQLASGIGTKDTYDRCYLARNATVTGGIQCHEIAWGTGAAGEPELWMVNTLFSCLATLDPEHSFVPRWRPPFITQLAGQDRCHLNGVALSDGKPAFVTAMAHTDEPAGWRQYSTPTGIIIDVASGETVTGGLAMPHSPRWHDGQLYVLNSGMGRLERINLGSGERDIVALMPGYARGLAFAGGYAFVGLSRIRETAVFGRVPIAEYHNQLKCGVGVVELATGQTVATLEFSSGIEEIFDVQVVPGSRNTFLGAGGSTEQVWLVPQPGPDF